MSAARPHLGNKAARAIFLDRHALAEPPTGPARGQALLDLIIRLGFVQVDSINTVARAHHMILHARRQSYRPRNLKPLLEKDRVLFEHWTHDAAVIPTAFYPHWRLRFDRDAEALRARWRKWRRGGFEETLETVRAHIAQHGATGSDGIGADERRGSGGWWDWHPSKTALEYLWRSGALSVCRRDGFRKIYDLTENVIPGAALLHRPAESETIDWACGAALDRLGFATSGEIAAFWGKATPAEAKDWCAAALRAGDIIEIDIEGADGAFRRSFARPDIEALAEMPRKIWSGVRVLSPFDPALRDRNRAERLFGFRYRIEVFVPEARRQYGYYVFPVLEGDRLIGRTDFRCRRDDGCLHVAGFWPEPGVRLGRARRQRIEGALTRTARFAGMGEVTFEPGWIRDQRQ